MENAQLWQYFKDKGLRTGEIAKMIGLDYTYTSGLINGSVKLTDSARFKIVRAFPETAEFLLQRALPLDPEVLDVHNSEDPTR